jgi:hypothetical protein
MSNQSFIPKPGSGQHIHIPLMREQDSTNKQTKTHSLCVRFLLSYLFLVCCFVSQAGLSFGGIALMIVTGLVCVVLVLGTVITAQHVFYSNRGSGAGGESLLAGSLPAGCP